jgi:hypothetical protein
VATPRLIGHERGTECQGANSESTAVYSNPKQCHEQRPEGPAVGVGTSRFAVFEIRICSNSGGSARLLENKLEFLGGRDDDVDGLSGGGGMASGIRMLNARPMGKTFLTPCSTHWPPLRTNIVILRVRVCDMRMRARSTVVSRRKSICHNDSVTHVTFSLCTRLRRTYPTVSPG